MLSVILEIINCSVGYLVRVSQMFNNKATSSAMRTNYLNF